MALMKLCAYAGCRKPVPVGTKYCDEHKARGEARDKEYAERREKRRAERKGTASARGYGYRWQQMAAAFRKAHPLCAACLAEGRYTPAACVDHIIPHCGDPALLYDTNNLQSLCWSCHSRKTASEDGGFGNSKSTKAQKR